MWHHVCIIQLDNDWERCSCNRWDLNEIYHTFWMESRLLRDRYVKKRITFFLWQWRRCISYGAYTIVCGVSYLLGIATIGPTATSLQGGKKHEIVIGRFSSLPFSSLIFSSLLFSSLLVFLSLGDVVPWLSIWWLLGVACNSVPNDFFNAEIG